MDRHLHSAEPDRSWQKYLDSGSPAAMARVFDSAAPELLVLARRLAADASAAEDLVHDTFVRAIERASTFAAERRLMPWLTAILVNESRASARGRVRRREQDAHAADELPARRNEDPSAAVDLAETRAALDAAFGQLADGTRDVVALRLLHDVPPRQIARALDLPVATVKTRLHRGVRQLAAQLPRGLIASGALAVVGGQGLRAARAKLLHGLPGVAATAGRGGLVASMLTTLGLSWFVMNKFVAVFVLAVASSLVYLAVSDSGVETGPGPGAASDRLAGTERRTDLPAVEAPSTGERSIAAPGPSSIAAGSPAESSSLPSDRLAVRVSWNTPDGDPKPAAGIAVVLREETALSARTEALGRTWMMETDLEGRLVFEGLPADASFRITEQRQQQAQFVAASRPEEGAPSRFEPVEFLLEAPTSLRGVVKDARGDRVPGATVSVASHPYFAPLRAVAHADAAGEFELRGFRDRIAVVAEHEGRFAARKVIEVEAAVSEPGMLELVLEHDAAELIVEVRDAAGAAVAGALVQAEVRPTHSPLDRIRWIESTNDAGIARLSGLPAGRFTVEVMPADAPPFRAVLDVSPGETERLDARLPEVGAVLVGRVRFSSGRPVVGADVSIGGDAANLLAVSKRTDAEGRFRVAGLPVGELDVRVDHSSQWRQVRVPLEAGEECEVEFELESAAVLRGQLLLPSGEVASHWPLRVVNNTELDNRGTSLRTDASGRFVAKDLASGSWRLEVLDRFDMGLLHVIHEVVADGVERTHTLPRQVVQRGGVRGRFIWRAELGADSEPAVRLVPIHASPLRADRSFIAELDSEGRFEFDGLPGVPYGVELRFADGPVWRFAQVTPPDGSVHDLGAITVPGFGSLRVDLTGIDPDAEGEPRVSVGGLASASLLTRRSASRFECGGLVAGRYLVRVAAAGQAEQVREVEIREGQQAEWVVEMHAGQAVAIAPTAVDGRELGWREYEVVNAAGQIVLARRWIGGSSLGVQLEVGSYTVRARTDSGLTGSVQIEVVESDEPQRVVVPLRVAGR